MAQKRRENKSEKKRQAIKDQVAAQNFSLVPVKTYIHPLLYLQLMDKGEEFGMVNESYILRHAAKEYVKK